MHRRANDRTVVPEHEEEEDKDEGEEEEVRRRRGTERRTSAGPWGVAPGLEVNYQVSLKPSRPYLGWARGEVKPGVT